MPPSPASVCFSTMPSSSTTWTDAMEAFTISGLTPELTQFALVATMVIVPLPALSVLLSLQRAILVEGRRTRHITVASAIEVASVAVVFITLGWGLDLVGATAAFGAFMAGRTAANLYLLPGCRRVMGEALFASQPAAR